MYVKVKHQNKTKKKKKSAYKEGEECHYGINYMCNKFINKHFVCQKLLLDISADIHILFGRLLNGLSKSCINVSSPKHDL